MHIDIIMQCGKFAVSCILERSNERARAGVDVVQRLQQAIAITRSMNSRGRGKQRRNAVWILRGTVLDEREGGKPLRRNRARACSPLRLKEAREEEECSPHSRSGGNNNPGDHPNATTIKRSLHNYCLRTRSFQHDGRRIGEAGKHNRPNSPGHRRNSVQEGLQ